MNTKRKEETPESAASGLILSPSESGKIVGPHYQFFLQSKSLYRCEKKGDAWIVYLDGPNLFVVGDPEEPLEALHPVFAEACCALWCTTIGRYYEERLGGIVARRENHWNDAKDLSTVWSGDELRTAFDLTLCFSSVFGRDTAAAAAHDKPFRSGFFGTHALSHLRELIGATLPPTGIFG